MVFLRFALAFDSTPAGNRVREAGEDEWEALSAEALRRGIPTFYRRRSMRSNESSMSLTNCRLPITFDEIRVGLVSSGMTSRMPGIAVAEIDPLARGKRV